MDYSGSSTGYFSLSVSSFDDIAISWFYKLIVISVNAVSTSFYRKSNLSILWTLWRGTNLKYAERGSSNESGAGCLLYVGTRLSINILPFTG